MAHAGVPLARLTCSAVGVGSRRLLLGPGGGVCAETEPAAGGRLGAGPSSDTALPRPLAVHGEPGRAWKSGERPEGYAPTAVYP